MKNLLLEIKDLEYAYPGYADNIINKFSQSIHFGDILGVIGRNGVGKSTLLRLMAAIHQPLSGNILINGIDSLNFKQRKNYLLHFIYLAHDKQVLADYTIQKYFDLYSPLYLNYSSSLEEKLMQNFHFEKTEKISSLSTGNRMKCFLIFAIASQVPLILLDEITAVLDPGNREEFFEIVLDYSKLGITFVIATNLVEDLNNFSNRVWLLDEKNIVETKAINLNGYFKKKVA